MAGWFKPTEQCRVVAVLGSQSSGKSTLLNRLFHTNFTVMPDDKRAQTTHGIWASRARLNGQMFLILDVEGADGRERGDDLDFERKSALFSLALADCLLVNLWEHSVGLYHGANMSLLRTVFDVHLQLFQPEARQNTTILFVVRDYLGNTPQANLRATLMADMQRLWASLQKPEALKESQVEDIFAFEFAFLPHLRLKPSEFDHACQELAGRFAPGQLLLPPGEKAVPIDGMALYARSLWEQIMANRDLDLPTQQELLSQFRCDEIAAAVHAEFMEMTQSLQRAVEAGETAVKFGSGFAHALRDCLAHFQRQAQRYAKPVVTRKAADLATRLTEHIHTLFLQHMHSIERMALNLFTVAMKELGGQESMGLALREATERSLTFYEAALQAAAIGEDWDTIGLLAAFKESLAGERAELVESLRVKRETALLKRHRRLLQERIDWDMGSDAVWEQVEEVNLEIGADLQADYQAFCRELGLSNHGSLSLEDSLLSFLQESSTDAMISMRLRQAFDAKFKRDAAGNPRVWSPTDDLEGGYMQARQYAMSLLETLSSYKEHELIDEKRQKRLAQQLTRDLEAVFVETKRSLLQQTSHIPWWIIVLLLVLGWNEFMAILRNPLLLLVLLMVGGAYFAGQMMGVNYATVWQLARQLFHQALQPKNLN